MKKIVLATVLFGLLFSLKSFSQNITGESFIVKNPNNYPWGISVQVDYPSKFAREFSITHANGTSLFSIGAFGENNKLMYGYIGGEASGNANYIAPWMTFLPSGNIGIGTTNPQNKLHVIGTTQIFNTANAGHLILSANDNSSLDQTQIGIDFKIADRNQVIGRIASFYDSSVNGGYGGLRFYYKNAGTLNEAMRIAINGYVGIGTDKPDQKLTVKGKIHAQEVLIDLSGPLADYVFKPDYKLMPLNELEQFVQTNSHLPEIPSAKEVAEKGLSVGEMQNKLLQKIEELTLYIIQQDKRIQELEKSQQSK